MSLEATEAECAAGRTAPRVSLRDIEAAILERYDFRACDIILPFALSGMMKIGHTGTEDWSLLSICLLRLANGFMIVGKSAPVSEANFDAELGKKLAYEDAVRQIWPLMGFALKDRLHRSTGE